MCIRETSREEKALKQLLRSRVADGSCLVADESIRLSDLLADDLLVNGGPWEWAVEGRCVALY